MEPGRCIITKEGPVVGGWDVTMGASLWLEWARHADSAQGGQTKETHTVVGQRWN